MRLLPFILASRRQERFAARSKEWRDTAVFAGKKIAKRNWKKNCNPNKAAKLLLRIIQRDAISGTSYIATSLNHFSGINHDETFAKTNHWVRLRNAQNESDQDLTLVSLDLARLQSFPTPMQHGITQNREQKLSFQIGIPNSHGIQEHLSYHCSSWRYDSTSSMALSFAIQTLHNQ